MIPRLLPGITEILKVYQSDPKVLCSLAIKLLGPLNFTQVMSLASEEAIIQALRSPAPSANVLGMSIIEKASKTPSEAAILAMMKNVVAGFLTCWLSASQVEVGEKGSRVLGNLMDIDCDTRPADGISLNGTEIAVRHTPGQGLVWRRLLHDRDIYALLLSLCSPGPHHNAEGGLTDQQLSLSQGRILRVLPRLAALNIGAISSTEFPDLNQRYFQIASDAGLLQIAALHMIDKEDVLMHLSLVDFFETLLSIQRITPYSPVKMSVLKTLLRDATREDEELNSALRDLPNRTIPEESADLAEFLRELISP
jgi:hypothetical protein